MREIKFRAKRIDMDRWVYGQYVITPITDENSGTTPDAGWFFLTGETRHCIVQNCVAFVIDLKTLGQFTGLKDKNGKKIYEGDIVVVDNGSYSGAVKFNEEDLSYVIENETGGFGFVNGQTYDERPEFRTYEVIGNIYDNPELLEVTP